MLAAKKGVGVNNINSPDFSTANHWLHYPKLSFILQELAFMITWYKDCFPNQKKHSSLEILDYVVKRKKTFLHLMTQFGQKKQEKSFTVQKLSYQPPCPNQLVKCLNTIEAGSGSYRMMAMETVCLVFIEVQSTTVGHHVTQSWHINQLTCLTNGIRVLYYEPGVFACQCL